MRHLLATSTVAALLVTSGSAVGAQEDDGAPPPAGTFEAAGSLSLARSGHTATLLPDGRVLVTGVDGLDPEDITTAEVWDPATSTFGPADELVEPRAEPVTDAEIDRSGRTATLLPDGRALIIGGSVDGAPIAEAELLTPDSVDLVPPVSSPSPAPVIRPRSCAMDGSSSWVARVPTGRSRTPSSGPPRPVRPSVSANAQPS